jgi:iron complex outermembrane receptor protein
MKYIKLNMGNAHKINAVIILLCCLTIQSLLAQTNTAKIEINGKITTSDGDPVVYATVLLENTNVATSSNENGLFSFYAPEGKYLIKVSSIGYQTIKKEFVVSPTNSSTVNFTLSESSNQLQEVEILGRKAKTYKNNETFAATKTATKIKDIPQAVSYVTKEVIADQQAYRVNDIIKNVSGVNQYSWYDDFSFRGFRSGQTYINGLRVIGLFGPQPLLANIERVEVLKGPASAMFGNSSPGGTMNRVTKKPLTEDRKH